MSRNATVNVDQGYAISETAPRRRFRPSAVFALLCAVVASGVGMGVASAAVPNTSTTIISACYRTSGPAAGGLRVIDKQAHTNCKAGEQLIEWSGSAVTFRGNWSRTVSYRSHDVVGYGGSAYLAKRTSRGIPPTNTTSWGLLAAKGAAGAKGATGANGSSGAPGPVGPAGPAGLTGPAGSRGLAGEQGAAGAQGIQGPEGQAGAAGSAGATGAQGAQGPAGPRGSGTAVGTLVLGNNYIPMTEAFVPSIPQLCLVTSNIQVTPTIHATNGVVAVRHSVTTNPDVQLDTSANAPQSAYPALRTYLYNGGNGGRQPVHTRSTYMVVNAGEPAIFGTYLNGVVGGALGWLGASYEISMVYSCAPTSAASGFTAVF